MNETDAMRLLAEANPVPTEALTALDTSVADRIVGRRRRPSRRLVLVAAIALAVLASALIAGITTGGHSGSSESSMEPELSTIGVTSVAQLPGKKVTLAEASTAIRQPIVLPDSSLVRASDAGAAWVSGRFPNVTAAVSFPSAGVFIDYTVPTPVPDMSVSYREIAQQNPRSFRTIELNGGTALAGKQNSDETGHNFGAVVFVLNGAEISVFGHYDEATLQAVAQSIIDRSGESASTRPVLLGPLRPSPHVGSAAAAQATVPFKLVLPSRARPLVIVVSPKRAPSRKRGVGAFFNTPAAGPFYVSESLAAADSGEEIRTVADLRQRAKSCHSHYLCPVHKIVRVHGVPVLVIGAPGKPGGLTLFWLRGHGRDAVLTWMQGPEDSAHGDLPRHVFRPHFALAVAADMIAHGG
jgi:hypothetical protein